MGVQHPVTVASYANIMTVKANHMNHRMFAPGHDEMKIARAPSGEYMSK